MASGHLLGNSRPRARPFRKSRARIAQPAASLKEFGARARANQFASAPRPRYVRRQQPTVRIVGTLRDSTMNHLVLTILVVLIGQEPTTATVEATRAPRAQPTKPRGPIVGQWKASGSNGAVV